MILSTELVHDDVVVPYRCEFGGCCADAEYAVRDIEHTGCRPKDEYYSCYEHLEPTRSEFQRLYELHRRSPILSPRSVYAQARNTRERIVVDGVDGNVVRWRSCSTSVSLSAPYWKLLEHPSTVFDKFQESDSWRFLYEMDLFGYEKLQL